MRRSGILAGRFSRLDLNCKWSFERGGKQRVGAPKLLVAPLYLLVAPSQLVAPFGELIPEKGHFVTEPVEKVGLRFTTGALRFTTGETTGGLRFRHRRKPAPTALLRAQRAAFDPMTGRSRKSPTVRGNGERDGFPRWRSGGVSVWLRFHGPASSHTAAAPIGHPVTPRSHLCAKLGSLADGSGQGWVGQALRLWSELRRSPG